jgi:hypothetical protein
MDEENVALFLKLIFVFKGIPELCMLADMWALFLVFYTFCIFQMAFFVFFSKLKLIYVHLKIVQKNITHKKYPLI